MSSASMRPRVLDRESPEALSGRRSVPNLDELRQWTTEPDDRVVIEGVDWDYYERLTQSIPEGANLRVDYDGRDLEIMSPGPMHDGLKKLLGRFLELAADELDIPFTGFGRTTWKRPELLRGLEADECYYFPPTN